jgi:hypothetical protein
MYFINKPTPLSDVAVRAYVDLYKDALPEKAIRAIHAPTRLGNKKIADAMAAIVAGSVSLEEMEVV